MSFTGPGNYKEIEEEIEVTFRNQKFTIKHKCYCNEKGEKFTTNRQDDDMMWAIFRAYWERKGFEHFYDIDGYREKQEPSSEDLEVAARRYAKEEYNRKSPASLPDRCRACYAPIMYAFRGGAKWQRERMMKDAVEADIAESFTPVSESPNIYMHGFTCVYEEKESTPYVVAPCKVKLIIIKE